MFCKKQSINQIGHKTPLLYIIKLMKKWSHRPQKGEKILTLDFCKKQSTTLTLGHKPTGREVERKEERYIEERYKVLKYNRKR